MSVDVVDVIATEASIIQRHLDATGGPATFGMGVGDSKGIGGRTVAEEFAVDCRPPGLGMLKFLEHDHCGSFAEHKAVTVVVERPTGSGRFVVAGGESRQQIEPGHAEWMNHAVGAAGKHDVCIPASHQFRCLANCLA